MTNFEKDFIKNLITEAIETAKKDRTTYEKNMLGLMDWQNKEQNAGEIFKFDENSTKNLANNLTNSILSIIDGNK
jgi:hypothetical protein